MTPTEGPNTTSVAVPGGALAYDHRPGAGPAIVLLHSGISDRRGFNELMEHLDASIGVVAYDRRGHGHSTAVGDVAHVDDLVTVLDHVRLDRAWLVGSSAGGQVALEAAVLHPDRVAGLILLAPVISGAPEVSDDEAVADIERLMEGAAGDVEARIRLETWLWLDGPHGPEGRVTGPGRALLAKMDRTTIAHGRSEHDGTRIGDLWQALPSLGCPTLFVAGSRDLRSIVETTAAAAERTPGAKYVLLRDRAHLPYLEGASEIARVILDMITTGEADA